MNIYFQYQSYYICEVDLDFLKKRVKQYQEKKLEEALSKMKFHLNEKRQLEEQLTNSESEDDIHRKISFHNKMSNIWKNNATKIKKELKKLDNS